jgi:glutaredoxin 3
MFSPYYWRKEVVMAKVEIFTTTTCPFCHAAKQLLNEKNVSYDEFDVTGDAPLRQAMTQRANGRTSVPQIFINDEHIGGCDDLMALDAQQKLSALLAS